MPAVPGSAPVRSGGIMPGACAVHGGCCCPFLPGPPASASPWPSPGRERPLGCRPRSPRLKGFGRERDGEKEEEQK